MPDEEFELKGTLEGVLKILEKDFEMSTEEAKFFVYVLVNQDRSVNVDVKEFNKWYLAKEEKYTGQIFNTHFTINFSNVIKKLYHEVYIFLFDFFFTRGFDLFHFGAELLFVICTAIQHISDEDYCVFSQIIQINIGNKGRLFSTKDIDPINRENRCDCQEDNWKCPHMSKYDECNINDEKIKLSLERLEKQDVIKKVGEFWVLQ